MKTNSNVSKTILPCFRTRHITFAHWIGLFALALFFQNLLHAQNWFPSSAPQKNWYGLAISHDGSYMFGIGGVANNPNQIYVSADSGTNWTATSATPSNYVCIACSSDGSNIVTGEYSSTGLLYRSTDFGLTWTNLSVDTNKWTCIASSADGSVLLAGTFQGLLWTSTNSGATWTHPPETSGNWKSVACSSSGDLLMATGGQETYVVLLSRDFGASWQRVTNLPAVLMVPTMSSDGTRLALAAVTWPNYNLFPTYTSVDSGSTWLSNSVPNVWPEQLSCSGDGSILVMSSKSGIYSSTDWGKTWVPDSAPNNATFANIACSTDATKMIASTDQIYVSPPIVTVSNVVTWGSINGFGTTLPPKVPYAGPAIGVAASDNLSFVIKPDRTVIGGSYSQNALTNIPTGLSNVVSIAVGSRTCLALKTDGTVTSWGSVIYSNVTPTLSNIRAIDASSMDTYSALRGDGTVVVWGFNGNNQTNVPASATNLVDFALGDSFCVGLRADGTIMGWGRANTDFIPFDASNVVAIATGGDEGACLKSDGTVVVFPSSISVPTGLSNVVAVSDCVGNFLALTSDGSVWQWGNGYNYRVGLPSARSIAAGRSHSLATVSDGSLSIVRQPYSQTAFTGAYVLFNVGATGAQPLSYQWQWNGTNIDDATGPNLFLTNVALSADGTYSCIVSNGDSAPVTTSATLNVVRSTPHFANSGALRIGDSGFTFPLSGLSGHGDILVYASTDLIFWDPIFTNPPTVGSLQLLDPNATNFPNRFYKAQEQ